MKRSLPAFGLLVWLLLSPGTARAQLDAQLRGVLADKALQKATVGVAVARLDGASADDATVVLAHNPTAPLVPASNLKLVTTAAALAKLGPGFEFITQLYHHRGSGDLLLVGGGDPALGDAELYRREPFAGHNWTADTVFRIWTAADKLRPHGVDTVRDVVVDDGIFADPFVHPNWPADQLHLRYVAGVAGLNLNANCIDFHLRAGRPGELVSYRMVPALDHVTVANSCVSGRESKVWLSREAGRDDLVLRGESPTTGEDEPVRITVPDPPTMAGHVLRQAVAGNGTPVTGVVRRDRGLRARVTDPGSGWRLVAQHKTPITEVLKRANKDSMNVYAEALCKRLGYETTGTGDWAGGTAALGDHLRRAGVPDDQFTIDDGCGLSRHNRVSPAGLVRVLADQFHGPHREAYVASLAVAGVDGTLDDRFRGTDLRGRVLGKSGYINKASCLSGYLTARDGTWYAFSVMFNGFAASNSEMKQLQERVVRAVDQHTAVATAVR